MSSSGQFLSLIAWRFLPEWATGFLQNLWYNLTIRVGDPKPQPGTRLYIQHRRRIYICVVTIYLLYTIYEADWEIHQRRDFYQDLGIPYDASVKEIKSRFRRLAALHHPDKVSSAFPSSEGYFVHLKLAQETLIDPAKRFAYDRFGASILSWQHCSSMKDYFIRGVQGELPYYIGGAVTMYVLGLAGYLDWGKYWRWMIFIILCVFELHTYSRPYFPPLATHFLNPILTTFTNHPPYLPFQLVQLTRKLVITLYIAFSHIGPVLQSPESARLQGKPDDLLRQQLDRLAQAAVTCDVEASRHLAMEVAPFVGDQPALREVQVRAKEWLVQNTIRSDPEVREAFSNSLRKRRVDAPAGARGNR